jgi:cytochrome P450
VQVADWLLNMNGPRHARISSLIVRAFTARRIAGLEPAIAKVADELADAIADRGVEEVLRFDAPIQHTMRTGHATRVGGVPVTGSTMLTVVLGAGNRDPRRFADPATFDSLRPVGGPLSFGGGAHFCIGAALARLQGAVAFPRLLNWFPDIAAVGEPVRQDRLFFLRGFDTLPVTVNPLPGRY